eukprot:jgi/Mesvir1/29197/Mv16248-RA.1
MDASPTEKELVSDGFWSGHVVSSSPRLDAQARARSNEEKWGSQPSSPFRTRPLERARTPPSRDRGPVPPADGRRRKADAARQSSLSPGDEPAGSGDAKGIFGSKQPVKNARPKSHRYANSASIDSLDSDKPDCGNSASSIPGRHMSHGDITKSSRSSSTDLATSRREGSLDVSGGKGGRQSPISGDGESAGSKHNRRPVSATRDHHKKFSGLTSPSTTSGSATRQAAVQSSRGSGPERRTDATTTRNASSPRGDSKPRPDGKRAQGPRGGDKGPRAEDASRTLPGGAERHEPVMVYVNRAPQESREGGSRGGGSYWDHSGSYGSTGRLGAEASFGGSSNGVPPPSLAGSLSQGSLGGTWPRRGAPRDVIADGIGDDDDDDEVEGGGRDMRAKLGRVLRHTFGAASMAGAGASGQRVWVAAFDPSWEDDDGGGGGNDHGGGAGVAASRWVSQGGPRPQGGTHRGGPRGAWESDGDAEHGGPGVSGRHDKNRNRDKDISQCSGGGDDGGISGDDDEEWEEGGEELKEATSRGGGQHGSTQQAADGDPSVDADGAAPESSSASTSGRGRLVRMRQVLARIAAENPPLYRAIVKLLVDKQGVVTVDSLAFVLALLKKDWLRPLAEQAATSSLHEWHRVGGASSDVYKFAPAASRPPLVTARRSQWERALGHIKGGVGAGSRDL